MDFSKEREIKQRDAAEDNVVALKPLPPSKRRILDAAEQIWGEDAIDAGQLGFIHAIHASCYFPRAAQKDPSYVHKNGAFSIRMEAGSLCDPEGDWHQQPLPFGGKPRALFVMLESYAVRHKTREIPLGHSFTDFVRRMSGHNTGGEKGNMRLWKAQLMAMAASSTRIGSTLPDDQTVRTKRLDFAEQIDIWFSPEPNQASLFPSSVLLTEPFFHHLTNHAMPVDLRAIRVLTSDPLAFDIFLWLNYRLCRIRQRRGVFLTWTVLFQQFSGGYSNLRSWKPRFRKALRKATVLYPGARIEERPDGYLCRSTPPLIRKSAVVENLSV